MCAFGNNAVFEIAPQRNGEASCDCDDRNAACAAVWPSALRAPVEPLRQRAVGLVAQPVPRDFDQQRAYPPVALFADALIGMALAAVVRLGYQTDTRPDFTAIAELPPEQF